MNQIVKALNSSGFSEIDVNCPLGEGWKNQRNSLAMIVNGGDFCTGSLINKTSGTIIPYFLNANHCGTNPGGWVFRFKYESPEDQADCGSLVLAPFCLGDAGIENAAHFSAVKIYPNPANSQLNIDLGNEMFDRVKITTVTEQLVYAHFTQAKNLQIDVSNLAKGVYAMHISVEKDTVSKQLIIN